VVRTASFVVLLLFASACRTVIPSVPLAADDPRPAALLEQWDALARERHSFRGRARLAVDGDVQFRGNQIVVLARPARMRIEVLGFLNQTAAVIATDGERFEVFRSGDRSYETGAVSPDLLWREARLALTPGEAVAVLLGVPVPGGELVPARADLVDGELIRIDLVGADGRVQRRAAFDAAARLREFEVIDDDGSVRWRAGFEDYADVDGVSFAHRIVLDVTDGGTHVEISLREVELNPELAPEVFRLRSPREPDSVEGDAG
jgi:hypothetical protein